MTSYLQVIAFSTLYSIYTLTPCRSVVSLMSSNYNSMTGLRIIYVVSANTVVEYNEDMKIKIGMIIIQNTPLIYITIEKLQQQEPDQGIQSSKQK